MKLQHNLCFSTEACKLTSMFAVDAFNRKSDRANVSRKAYSLRMPSRRILVSQLWRFFLFFKFVFFYQLTLQSTYIVLGIVAEDGGIPFGVVVSQIWGGIPNLAVVSQISGGIPNVGVVSQMLGVVSQMLQLVSQMVSQMVSQLTLQSKT